MRDDIPERQAISFLAYSSLEKRGITPTVGMYQKTYVASSDILPEHGAGMGETLEAIFQKFNIDRPKDFKGHSLSVSDVVVVGRDAYYVDKAGYKPLHDFMRESIGRDRSAQESGPIKEEQKQDKPDVSEKTAEYHKRKSR